MGTSPKSDDNTCVECLGGNFKSTTGDFLECKPYTVTSCGTGQGLVPGNAMTDTVCAICGGGKYSAVIGGGACTDCVSGQYSSDAAQVACIQCASGQWQALNGTTACIGTECSTRSFGLLGQTSSVAVTCSLCAPGKFQNDQGRSICDGCTIRQQIVTDSSDRDSCENCKPGQLANAAHTGCTCDR